MDVQRQEIEHLNGVIAAQKLEKEEIELVRIKIKGKYQKIKVQYEGRVGRSNKLEANLAEKTVIVDQYQDELETLRKKTERLEK